MRDCMVNPQHHHGMRCEWSCDTTHDRKLSCSPMLAYIIAGPLGIAKALDRNGGE